MLHSGLDTKYCTIHKCSVKQSRLYSFTSTRVEIHASLKPEKLQIEVSGQHWCRYHLVSVQGSKKQDSSKGSLAALASGPEAEQPLAGSQLGACEVVPCEGQAGG